MTIAESFAAEFRREAATTRKFFERFDGAHADWKPHEKSMPLAKLASHVADIPNWLPTIVDADDFDFATSDYQVPDWRTREDLLAGHDRNTERFLAVLEGRTDDHLAKTWRFRVADQVHYEGRRDAAVREFILSHAVHHRAQLGVYYRLLGIPIPGSYGPSADES